jgi:thiamine-monophosphate kinase
MRVMKKLSEKQIIRYFQKQNLKKFVAEDVEIFLSGKTKFAISIDTLVQSTDIPPKSDFSAIARKSIVSSVSDFASKGIIPKFCIVSVTFPKNISKKQVVKLSTGFNKACNEFNLKLLGGDTNEGKEIIIHSVLFGSPDKIIPRNGAKIGDVIITTGAFGYQAAALDIMNKKRVTTKKFLTKSKKLFFRPVPRLEFGYSARNLLSSSMDSSDGLSTCLNELSIQSRKKFVIKKLPVNSDLIDYATKNKLNLSNLIFNGGEEFELVCTVSPKNLAKIYRIAKKKKINLFEIGYVTRGKNVVSESHGKRLTVLDKGWKHFEV